VTSTEHVPDVAVVLVHYHTPALAAEAIAALRADDRHGLRIECVIVDNGSDAAGAETLRALATSASAANRHGGDSDRLPAEASLLVPARNRAGVGRSSVDVAGAVAAADRNPGYASGGNFDVTVLTAGRNLGYAGGVNFGVASTRAPIVIAMNADVVVRPGCLAALRGELLGGSGGCGAAGPRFSWDRAGRLLLPPTERRDFTSEALARLSARGEGWARAARRRWRGHARRHWEARESIDSYALSGALLAFRRDVWDAIGPFDDGYRLYFEETDWLARLAARGWRGRYVPAAQAVHHYNRSARDEPEARAWFTASARRFEEKHVGRVRARWLRWLEATGAGTRDSARRATAGAAAAAAAQEPGQQLPGPSNERGGVNVMLDLAHHVGGAGRAGRAGSAGGADGADSTRWIEISSQPAGYPAAAERLVLDAGADAYAGVDAAADDAARLWRMPVEIWDHLAPGAYTLRVVDDDGRECTAATFRR
jgi:GT2 family glycosyltransferase